MERYRHHSLVTAALHEAQYDAIVNVAEVVKVVDQPAPHLIMMLILYIFPKFLIIYSKGICSSSSYSSVAYFSFSDWVSSSLFFLRVVCDERYFHSL